MELDGCVPQELPALLEYVELSRAGWRGRAIRELLLGILWLSNESISQQKIGATLRDICGGSISQPLIEEQLEYLIGEGSVVSRAEGSVRLSQAVEKELDRRVADSEQLSRQAESHFAETLRRVCPGCDTSAAWRSLNDHFLTPLLKNLGARTYDLILGAPGRPDWVGVFESFASCFPEERRRDLRQAVTEFLNPDNRVAREYVLRCLNAYLALQATALSEETISKLAAMAQPTFVIFVDTNFAFSLLDLHENPANESVAAVHTLLESLPEAVEVHFHILPTTVAEAKDVLVRSERALRRLRAAANIAEAALGTDLSGVTKRYFEAIRGGYVRSDAAAYFQRYIQNFLRLLRDRGVELYNCNMDAMRRRQDVIDDILAQLEWEKKFGDRAKTYERLMHDVTFWYFVHEKRSSSVESPAEATYWGVTVDMRLLAFDAHKTSRAPGGVPVCLHPATLLQLLQFWAPRSEAFERAMLGSMRLPFLFTEFDPASERVTVDILAAMGSLDSAESIPVETVRAIMLNEALRERMMRTDVLEEKVEAVRVALAAEYAALASEKARLEDQLKLTETRSTALAEDLTAAKEQAARNEAHVRSLETRLDALQGKLDEGARKRQYLRFATLNCAIPLGVIAVSVGLGGLYVAWALGQTPLRVMPLLFSLLCLPWLRWTTRLGLKRPSVAATRLLRTLQRSQAWLLVVLGAVLVELIIRVLFGH